MCSRLPSCSVTNAFLTLHSVEREGCGRLVHFRTKAGNQKMKNKAGTLGSRKGGNKLIAGLTTVLIALTISLTVVLFMVNRDSQHDREYTNTTAELRVLSQQIAKNATEAVSGNASAFDQLNNTLSEIIPQMQAEYEGVSMVLQSSGAAEAQIALARRQSLLAERMFRSVNNVLFGNEDAVLRVSPDLLKVSNAANNIFENSEILLTELSELATELRDLSAARIISPTLAFAMLAAAIAIVVFIGWAVCRKSQTQLAKTQTQNDQNQSAILRLLDELADASEHQAREIAGTSAAVNEMAVSIDQVSSNAAESSAAAERSVAIAKKGTDVVQNTVRGMDNIREQVQETSKRIKRLGESSQEIGDIVSLINDIADQTNILSLNAAIQASMAGDAGRGFAVVADEVQRLAERSSAATKQVEALVKTIQSDANEAVISMEHTTVEVVRGARLAQDSGVALEEVENVSTNLAELIQNISNAARRQSSSAAHISNTMNVIQEITSQTSSGTNATAYSIGNLADMAFELRSSVAGFKLPEEDEVADIKVPLVS